VKRLLILFTLLSTHSFALGPWLQKASLTASGRHLACSMTIGQCGYVGGGWDGTTTFNDFWEYDPSSNSWTQKADAPALMWNVPCFGIDTAGYFCFPGNTWMFRPTANTWTNVNPAAPPNTYIEERKWVINGKGYVTDQANIYRFDPATFQWTTVYTLPNNQFAPDIGFAIGNKAYMMDNSYQKFWEYDPTASTLTQKAVCPLNNTVGVGFSINGKGYCGLGFTITQVGSIKDMAEYDPASNTWKRINDFEGSDRRKATSFVIGNRGYIACGSSGINLCDLWEFDPNKATGVNDASAALSLTIYPNPSRDGKFYLEGLSGTRPISECDIWDANGKLVKTISDLHPSSCIDLSDQSNGVYFVRMGTTVKKVVIQK
jgi:N-acetylneuraminic acid mutarotase